MFSCKLAFSCGHIEVQEEDWEKVCQLSHISESVPSSSAPDLPRVFFWRKQAILSGYALPLVSRLYSKRVSQIEFFALLNLLYNLSIAMEYHTVPLLWKFLYKILIRCAESIPVWGNTPDKWNGSLHFDTGTHVPRVFLS